MATTHGPFIIDCFSKSSTNDYQYYDSSPAGLPYGLSVESGHACTLDENLDGLHVKYANQYLDISQESAGDGTKGRCKQHDQGVSCALPLKP